MCSAGGFESNCCPCESDMMRNVVLMSLVMVLPRVYRDCVGSSRCHTVVRACRVVKCLESVGRGEWGA